MDGPLDAASLKQLKTHRADYIHAIKQDGPFKKELKEKLQAKFNALTHSAGHSAPLLVFSALECTEA